MCVVDWVDWVRECLGVECGIFYGVLKDEIDCWSKECKVNYVKSGVSIVFN